MCVLVFKITPVVENTRETKGALWDKTVLRELLVIGYRGIYACM